MVEDEGAKVSQSKGGRKRQKVVKGGKAGKKNVKDEEEEEEEERQEASASRLVRSPPTNVRWVEEEELKYAALPSVMRKVLQVFLDPSKERRRKGKQEGGEKKRMGKETNDDGKQRSIAQFFSKKEKSEESQ